MRKTLRTVIVCALVVALSCNPAAAWHWFRGGGCGGYSSYGWGSAYSSCYGGYGSSGNYYGGSCGYAPLSYYGGDCGGCGGCDGCSDGYGYVDSCGCGGEVGGVIESEGYYDGQYVPEESVLESAPVVPEDTTPPSRQRLPAPQQRERPMTTTPRPQLPPEPMPERAQPAAEPADDLFGPPADEVAPPAEDMEPATTPPITPPVTPPPAEEPDDLFGPSEPAETTPPATTPPAETPETDDLFGPTAIEETPAPQTTPAEPAMEETDDLFGEPAATPPADEAEATEAPAEEATEEDDIFGTSTSILREPGGLASSELRTWMDNTGKHSCRGRLVRFLDDKVRILKDNGRTTTVPLYRLSTNDLSFVNRQASAKQTVEAEQVAQSPSSEPLAAN